jgi:nucleoside-diphosphate-sugar epimerase
MTDHLLSLGHQVTCLDLLVYQNNNCVVSFLNNPNYRFVYGDMRDPVALTQALEGITDVVLLAGLVGDKITKTYPRVAELLNDIGTLECIDYLNGRGLDRVIFTSSCSNYGMISSDDLADENYPLGPTSLYAEAKVKVEQHLLSLKDQVDYSPTILRFATAFGLSPRMRFDLTIGDFAYHAARGEELTVFGLNTWRPYCHVRDFARLTELVLTADKDKIAFEVFNGGGEINNFTKQGIVDIILSCLPDAKINIKDQINDPRNYKVNFSKVQQVLGFYPAYTVEHGVKEVITATKQHLFDNVDTRTNFGAKNIIDYNDR